MLLIFFYLVFIYLIAMLYELNRFIPEYSFLKKKKNNENILKIMSAKHD